MKKSRFSDEQIVGFLRQAEAGIAVKDLCSQNGFNDATFYKWRARFGGMQAGAQLAAACTKRRGHDGRRSTYNRSACRSENIPRVKRLTNLVVAPIITRMILLRGPSVANAYSASTRKLLRSQKA